MESLDGNTINKKRKNGRPRLLPEERRAYSIRPGFNSHEFTILEERAESAGIDLSEFVRRLALNQQFHSLPAINRDALVQLARIGQNLNQLARIANAEGSVQPIKDSIGGIKSELEKITLTLTVNETGSE